MDHSGPRAPQKNPKTAPKRPTRPERRPAGRPTPSILELSQPHWLILAVR